ncbi:MAG: hypothetical protein EOP07_04965 [Proteobacteria bacterium]|nr:MAG: hypothetical protein EOP07_04965 [Pseudomonadota bacterium]
MKNLNILASLALIVALAPKAFAGVEIAPYVSIKSTKSVTPGKNNSEDESIKQRQEYGIRATVSFWRLFKTQLSIGQSKSTTTHKTGSAVDEYGEIDYNKDFNMDTSNPDNEMKLTETQRIGKFSLILDPSFSIFIARLKVGITARQRIIDKEEVGRPNESVTEGPTYKPNSGVGLGVRFGPRMYFMAEYEMYHYKYPKLEPFERELSVSYNVSL